MVEHDRALSLLVYAARLGSLRTTSRLLRGFQMEALEHGEKLERAAILDMFELS